MESTNPFLEVLHHLYRFLDVFIFKVTFLGYQVVET